jgi:hypothetical protein
MPWPVRGAVLSTICMIVGWNWDISWHRSIGRDTVWTPPHVAIYVALLIAFVYSAALVLRQSRAGQGGISVFGLRGPSGAFLTLWAVLLQFTAIVFDNWWHSVYGIDAAVSSPPHLLLGFGVQVFYFGQILLLATLRNRGEGGAERATRWGLLLVWSFFLGQTNIGLDPQFGPRQLISETSLLSSAATLPFVFVAIDEGLDSRRASSICAALSIGLGIAVMQVFQLFPATPRFGPVFHRIPNFLPPLFPPLLVVPAAALALTLRALRDRGRPGFAAAGAAFVACLLLANGALAALLQSDLGRNRFFGGGYPGSAFEADFRAVTTLSASPRGALLVVFGIVAASVSARVGAWLGRWLRTAVR